ncbi:hypothetical protein CRE_29195 [Caenorhabditis remanei]|uniref:Large ribosomal subunit protein mL44 n=1 Tax=Caenorhabditis remanei TaxID=31234 RepID=E3NFY2_CAERE|nr:hypothetical protein CRE_29195 [Caenorhabditis remanei]
MGNWLSDYNSELYAFGHRIGAPEISENEYVKALTNESFFERADVEEQVERAQPGAEIGTEHNGELVRKGEERLSIWLKRYLRFHLAKAPEELIDSVDSHLLNDECLAGIAGHLGIDHLVRTKEFPISQQSSADAFRALAGIFSDEKVKNLVIDFIVPQLVDIDFADIYPLADPLAVLTDLLKAEGVTEIEPRLLRSAGENSAEPIFVVAIYADKQKNVGQSAGESVTIAIDMAAREALLRLWNITSDRVLFFGDRAASVPLEKYSEPNYSLTKKCAPGTNTSLLDESQPTESPDNLIEAVLRYRNIVDAEVGKSYTKRLRHKFSRGSLAKRSFRYLVKPKPYTVA